MSPRGSVGAACPGGYTGTSRAPRRQTLGGRCAARGSLLCTTWTSSWSCRDWHARRDGRRLQQAGAPLLAQPVAVTANGEDVAVMEQAVEDGGCHHGVTEYLRVPLFRID